MKSVIVLCLTDFSHAYYYIMGHLPTFLGKTFVKGLPKRATKAPVINVTWLDNVSNCRNKCVSVSCPHDVYKSMFFFCNVCVRPFQRGVQQILVFLSRTDDKQKDVKSQVPPSLKLCVSVH